MLPNTWNYCIPVLTERKPTADELYLKALEIRADYIVKAAQVGTLKIDDGPISEELKKPYITTKISHGRSSDEQPKQGS